MLRTEPRPYQRKGIKKFHKFQGRVLLADEMGLGKSLQALAYGDEKDLYPILIICPKTIKYNWQKEVKKHLGKQARILEGRRPEKLHKGMRPMDKVVIINYDILGTWKKWIRKLRPKYVIIDEVQDITGLNTQRSQNVREVVKPIPYVVGISGTAFMNRPAELYCILHILRPDIFENFWEFSEKFVGPKMVNGKWDHRGAKNLDQLHELLKQTCMIRRKKSEVLTDLPPLQRTVIPLEISDRKEYKRAVTDFYGWLKERGGVRKARRASRADMFVQFGYLKRLAAELKLKAFKEWLNAALRETDEKFIVYGIHKNILVPLHQEYPNSVIIRGVTSAKKRSQAVDEFNHTKKCRLMFGQLKAAGAGWNSTACSKTLHLEFWWNPAMHQQGEARVHGLARGVEGIPSEAYYFPAHGTVEERICEILQTKQNIFDQVFDGAQNVEDFSLFDMLCDELEKGAKL